MSKPGLTRVTLFLDPSVARRFAVIAAEQGTDRSSLVTQWVEYVTRTTATHSHQED